MKYMLLIYDDESAWASMAEDESKSMFDEYLSFSNDLVAAGQFVAGDPLESVSTATTVRVRDGRTTTTDGPFAETKEQLAGYYVVDVPSLDEALAWAAKVPSARIGSIEVRPVQDMSAPPAGS